MTRNRKPSVFQVGKIRDDGRTVVISGWGLGRRAAACACHRHPSAGHLAIAEDQAGGSLGLASFPEDGCDCCEPWTAEEPAAVLRDFEAREPAGPGAPRRLSRDPPPPTLHASLRPSGRGRTPIDAAALRARGAPAAGAQGAGQSRRPCEAAETPRKYDRSLTSAPAPTCRYRLLTVRTDAHGTCSLPRAGADRRRQTVSPRGRPPAAVRVPRWPSARPSWPLRPACWRRPRPTGAPDRRRGDRRGREAADDLAVVDEQVHQAEPTVAEQQQAAADAAAARRRGQGRDEALRAGAAGDRADRLHQQLAVAGWPPS